MLESSEALTRELSRFINYKSREGERLGRAFAEILRKLPDTVVFGGMIREFALGHGERFESDIDLVTMSDRSQLHSAIGEFHPIQNKFGGYRFVVGRGQHIDIWPFDETWAFRAGLVHGHELEDLVYTTFFNLDAAIYHLSLRKLAVSSAFVAGLKARVLDINLEQNPRPNSMATRACRLALGNSLGVGPSLARLLSKVNLESTDLETRHFLSSVAMHVSRSPNQVFRYGMPGVSHAARPSRT
jgi:hypothetical protein